VGPNYYGNGRNFWDVKCHTQAAQMIQKLFMMRGKVAAPIMALKSKVPRAIFCNAGKCKWEID